MAPEGGKSNKRKGAAEAAPKPKKLKKSDGASATSKASARALSAAVKPLDDLAPPPKARVAARKRAEDFLDEDTAAVSKRSKAKSKKVKGADEAKAAEDAEAEVEDWLPPAVEHSPSSKPTAAKKQKKKQVREPSPQPLTYHSDSDDNDDEDGVDDQTAALLAGFESDRDESDLEKEDEDVNEDGLKAKIPKKLSKELKKASGNEDEPGVIYVGRIPHGFFEAQMKGYFSQFGKINRLRLSRNKKTGASKHYAFIEFASAEVAEIVAKTMHNYLMFGRILQCKVVPPEQVHADLFKGSNQRFKAIPRNKMAGAQMARGATRDVWEKRVENETKRRKKNNKKLAEKLGYQYEGPAVTSVDQVPKQAITVEDLSAQQLLLEAPADEVADTIFTTKSKPGELTVTQTKKTKKGKKDSKKAVDAQPDAEETVPSPELKTVVEVKSSKTKKSKPSTSKDNEAEELVVDSLAEAAPKAKKAKKAAKDHDAGEDVGTVKKRKTVVTEQIDAPVVTKHKKAKKAKA